MKMGRRSEMEQTTQQIGKATPDSMLPVVRFKLFRISRSTILP
jgi:hypothetical protein